MVAMQDIKTFSDAIVREFHPDRIILFGSHARGEAGRDSDVDLLVIMRHRGHAIGKAAEIRLRVDCAFPLDLLVRSPHQIEHRLEMNDWFIKEIIEQGKVLHGRRDERMCRKGGSRLSKRGTRAKASKVAQS